MGRAESSLPRMLGRYELHEKIASGGMASVHIGRLVGPVGFARTVAIKRIHSHFVEDPEFASMLLDEARLASRIRHPNVVPTLDVVATDGEMFLVMDFVQGESLAHLIAAARARGERIPPALVASIIVGVLHGLHAAHEATSEDGEPLEVVHRDVSPQNVLVGVDGVARVLDFGVAKAEGRLQTSRDGQLKGKLAYMAPEQLRGNVTRVSDVYSASVVLWEALTGKRLFQGNNEGHVFERVLRGCDEPPSTHAPGVSPLLDAVTMRGLEVDPAKRFPTAREMACALEEATALATASKVGAWVEGIAKETLDERSARIVSIESKNVSVAAGSASEPSSSGVRPHERTTEAVPVTPTGDVLTRISGSSVSSSPRTALVGKRTRTLWLAAVGGLLFVGLLGGAVAFGKGLRSRAPAGSLISAPAPAAVSADAPSASVASSGAPSTSAPTEPAVETVAVSRDRTAVPRTTRLSTASFAARAVSSNAPPTPRAPVAKTPPAPAESCDPPYTINAAGHRVRKPECL